MLTQTEIIAAATHFRQALMEISSQRPPILSITFRDFPRGSCGDASVTLLYHLSTEGGSDLRYVTGTRHNPSFHSHAWCEVDGFYVDVTGDQFEGRGSVTVRPTADPWFAQWEDRTTLDFHSPQFGTFAAQSMLGFDRVDALARTFTRA